MPLLWLTLACGEDDESGILLVDSWLQQGMPQHWSSAPISSMTRTSEVWVTEEFRCWRWDSPEGPGLSVGEVVDGELAWVDSFLGEVGGGEPSPSIEFYQQAWALPGKRDLSLSQSWSEQGRWVDPVKDVTGREALSEHIEQTMTGPLTKRFTFVEVGGVDIVEGRFRFHWDMQWRRSGNSVMRGLDYGRFDEAGQIELLVGCWER